MKQKLNAKDFILIGILTALMWIICMIISTIMSVAGPVTNVFYPSVVAIPNGIVMMLLLAKVPKKGVFTICAAIQAILFLLVGAFWFIPIGLVIGGVICDFLIMGRNEITMKSMMAAYALFSAIFAFSAICPIKFLQSAFVGAMEKNNIAPEYIQGMLNITSVPMLVVIVAAGLVGGLIGGAVNRLFGRKLKDSGIEGTFGGASGFEGRQFEYYKGGLFRSNKTKYKDLDEETRAALDEVVTTLGATSVRDMGRVMAELRTHYAGQMDFGAVGPAIKERLMK